MDNDVIIEVPHIVTGDRERIGKIIATLDKLTNKGRTDMAVLQDAFALARSLETEEQTKITNADGSIERIFQEDNFKIAHSYSKKIRGISTEWLRKTGSSAMADLHRNTLLFDAKYDFDAYCRYLEWNRPKEKKFYEPRRKQLKVLADDLQDLYDDKIDFLSVSCPPRVGKALEKDTPVLTTNGWKKHGELVAGDYVAAPNGKFVKVLQVHPDCEMEYVVEFTNGEKITCHGNHEWRVYDRHTQTERDVETKDMRGKVDMSEIVGRGHRYYFMLPHKEVLEGEKKDLPVKPYTLGVWLGDGRNTNPDICGSKEDMAIIEKAINDEGYETAWHTTHKTTGVEYRGFRQLRFDLQTFDMCHSRRRVEKYIPDIYLTASIEQRLELLAGLLDTDGTLVKKEHRYHFTTSEKKLCDSVVALVSTFGWRCSVGEVLPRRSSSGIVARKMYYRIGFCPTMHIPCRLERKQLFEFSEQRRIAVKSVVPCRKGMFGNCITVEGGMYCAGNTLIPTHNSTICIFFMSFLMGNRPLVANVMSGHSDKLTEPFFRELLNIFTDTNTYNWHDIFPDVVLKGTSAKNETIDLNTNKRFPSFTARAVEGTLTGAVEIGKGGLLYLDDLVKDLEESMSPDRLQKKYDAYLNQLKDRKKDGAKELMVGTRWNVLDPIGRVQQQYADNPRYRFRVMPALNEDGESNFDYLYGLGFSTEYYLDMKDSIDDATWCAKYMGDPYIREGVIFPKESLKRYFEIPSEEPDAIWAVCDPAQGGGDQTVLPIFYQYGDEHYLVDIVCSDALPDVTDELCADKLVFYKVRRCQYESNAAGTRTATNVQDKVKSKGGITKITTRHNQKNKVTRIISNSTWVKEHILFKDDSVIEKGSDYAKALRLLTMYAATGHVREKDDVPDVLSQYADFAIDSLTATAELRKRVI